MEHDIKILTDLPKDLVLNIFGRLNCEELVPLTVVCKQFYHYVKSKAFTTNHKNNDNLSASRLILSQLACEDEKITTKLYLLDLNRMWLSSVKIMYSNALELFINFIGSENGLLCI